MAAIQNNTESWNGHTKGEVETHIKSRFSSLSCGIMGTGVTAIVALTESEYAALTTKDTTTLYIVKPDPPVANSITVRYIDGYTNPELVSYTDDFDNSENSTVIFENATQYDTSVSYYDTSQSRLQWFNPRGSLTIYNHVVWGEDNSALWTRVFYEDNQYVLKTNMHTD